jgi:hypothetical protein
MASFFRNEEYDLGGKKVTLTELSTKQWNEIRLKMQEEEGRANALVVNAGSNLGMQIDAIEEELPRRTVDEMARRILIMSDLLEEGDAEKKGSGTTIEDNSSSN